MALDDVVGFGKKQGFEIRYDRNYQVVPL